LTNEFKYPCSFGREEEEEEEEEEEKRRRELRVPKMATFPPLLFCKSEEG